MRSGKIVKARPLNHPWVSWQLVRMYRTSKDVTVKRFHCDNHA